jgi:hypothetical protein
LRLVAIFILAVTIHLGFSEDAKGQNNAQPDQSFVEKMRPQLMKIIGEEWTVRLIGAEAVKVVEVAMPKIPVVLDDATSTAVYNKKVDTVVLAPEIEHKFYYNYIVEVYEVTRQTKPNDDEIGKMMNVLTQGGTREGVYRSFVLDSVYGGMENWDKPVKSVTADYAVYFYEKYFGKKIQKKSFEGMSIYTLKRLVTEKALEVVDAFGDDRDGLERWYALMSADFATRFPQIWSTKIRKDTSASVHKSWAANVPVQHIKSEVIIKIHSALNSMI